MTIEKRREGLWKVDDEWVEIAQAWNDAIMARFPFAGIVPERPYPQTGLTTARWRAEVAPMIVLFRGLWLTQQGVDVMSLFGIPAEHTADDPVPHVVFHNGRYYLEDGHSRVIRLAMGCATWTIARVWHTDTSRSFTMRNADTKLMIHQLRDMEVSDDRIQDTQ